MNIESASHFKECNDELTIGNLNPLVLPRIRLMPALMFTGLETNLLAQWLVTGLIDNRQNIFFISQTQTVVTVTWTKNPRPWSSYSTAVKTTEVAPPKKIVVFTIFTNKILCSTLARYVVDIGIDVIIISVAQKRNQSFRFLEKFSQKLGCAFAAEKRFAISHEKKKKRNNNSFHLNFTSCKHRHRYYQHHSNFRTIANFKFFFERDSRVLRDFTHD